MKKVAFIDECVQESDVNEETDRKRLEETLRLIQWLSRSSELKAYPGLCWGTYRDIKQDCSTKGRYDFIITHIPPDTAFQRDLERQCEKGGQIDPEVIPYLKRGMSSCVYGPALRVIDDLKADFPETVFIAYTEAREIKLPEKLLKKHNVSHVVRKYEVNEDACLLLEIIHARQIFT